MSRATWGCSSDSLLGFDVEPGHSDGDEADVRAGEGLHAIADGGLRGFDSLEEWAAAALECAWLLADAGERWDPDGGPQAECELAVVVVEVDADAASVDPERVTGDS
ncbi:hypothetical protein ACFPRL_18100 [Pseudoclavibacter helvolus]